MSKVTLTLLQRCGVHFGEPVQGIQEPCINDEHHYHDGYLPFFNDNNSLLNLYNRIIQNR